MDFLSIGIHSVGGTVGIGKLNHIIVIAGQCVLSFPLICSINLCPGNILSNSIYGKYGLFRQIKVSFSNGELNLGLTLGVVNVVVFSYLIISKGPLIFQSGCDGICYYYIFFASTGGVTCFVNQVNRNSATSFSFDCMCCGKYCLIVCILYCSELFSRIGCLIGIVLTISLSVCNLEVLNTCGLILNSYLNLYVSLIEAEGYGLKNLIPQ